ncbi:unnamed protein product [Polarella glacialis]|uniref:Uncharacterized protein n=1 Tax=Polarella glacialis TaxID=89957 RepID=A0A813K3P7_POLGL|nr:unnamed protein product [Polarella glacialis]
MVEVTKGVCDEFKAGKDAQICHSQFCTATIHSNFTCGNSRSLSWKLNPHPHDLLLVPAGPTGRSPEQVKKHASTETDASEWLSGTQWACALEVQKQTLQKTQEALVTIGQLKEAVSVDKVYHAELCRLTD